MPMDGITTGFIARELDRMLRGGRVDKITQPERDTVIVLVRNESENRRLLLCASPNNPRCHLTNVSYSNPLEPPAMCMMLRKQLLGSRVISVSQSNGDRVVHVDLDTINEMGDHVRRRLILEMMGRHSNLIFADEDGRILEASRHVSADMNRVRQIIPGLPYAPPPPQEKMIPGEVLAGRLETAMLQDPGLTLDKLLGREIMGLGAVSARELAGRVMNGLMGRPEDVHDACVRAADLANRLPELEGPCCLMLEDGTCQDFFAFPYLTQQPSQQRKCRTLSEAMERFFGNRDLKDRLQQKSASMVRILKTQIERCERKLALQEEELAGAARMEEYRIMGDVINANLWQIKKGMREITLSNFYDENGGSIRIPLDEQLTPVQNAQRFFKKYQKARNARQTAAEQKEKTLEELTYLEGALLDVDKCATESDLEDIRQDLVRTGYVKRSTSRKQQRDLPKSRPYRYLSSDGIEILVGKNSAQNEKLTLGAHPDETWLHVKDMPGSHVIIRCEKDLPDRTLLEAARLAAWYSQGRNSSGVPVDYTLRKYVKKPAGTPTGYVHYTHQHTLFITVQEEEIRQIALQPD